MKEPMDNFKDILEERRKEVTHIPWVNRNLNLLKPYLQGKKILPAWHKDAVESSRKLQDIVAKISGDCNIPERVVLSHVREILDEIGYNKSIPTLRTLAYVLTKICTTVCRGIFVNQYNADRVKSEIGLGSAPVLYLPSHRSYADFILMSYVLFSLNIEIPAIAAGMDFHSMVGMGKVLRDTGAFFMRRSYNSDDLYWDIFRQYVLQMIKAGNTGIEFFIEGTRSRSGKSLQPKFGLLSMILKAFLTGEIHNLLIVPINISYERIMEENLFAYELLGVPKPPESTSGFFKALKIINEDFGNIHIDFGAPIHVRDFFQGRVDRSLHVMKPLHLQEFSEKERSVIADLAEFIVHQQQRLTVVTTFNIIAAILNQHLITSKQQNITLTHLIAEIHWFKSILEALHAISPVITENTVADALKVHKNLVCLENNTVCLVSLPVRLNEKQQAKMKGHVLSDGTMAVAVPVVKLQIYVNPVLHYVVDAAIVVSLLSKRATDKEELLKNFKLLRELLSKEFVYPKNAMPQRFYDALNELTNFECIKVDGNGYVILQANKFSNFLLNLIQPFLFTYFIVCNVLREISIHPCSEKTIFVNCQRKLEEIMQYQFVHPYCLNLDSLSNCRNTLIDMGTLEVFTQDGQRFYSVDVVKIGVLIEDLESILEMQEYKLHLINKL